MTKKNGSIREGVIKMIKEGHAESIDEALPFEERLKQPFSYKYKWALKLVGDYAKSRGLKRSEVKILDAGCGTGMMTYLLKATGYNVECLDIDDKNEKIVATHSYGVPFHCKDIVDTGIENEEYDVVISLQSIEHIKEHYNAIGELYRVIKKEGMLLISVPIGRNLYSKEHVHFFDFYDLVELFNSIGTNFKICRLRKFFKNNTTPKNIFGVRFIKGEKDE
jgi:2-polyprenyl-3-methyl-5-hydroxy-6-metoxy-1,4-benzoquinol methylase